jgi:pimeloyl-ACP methyl ester carboxylesterase
VLGGAGKAEASLALQRTRRVIARRIATREPASNIVAKAIFGMESSCQWWARVKPAIGPKKSRKGRLNFVLVASGRFCAATLPYKVAPCLSRAASSALTSLGIERAHFMGNSIGGSTLLTVAADPQPVWQMDRIVVVSGGGHAPENEVRQPQIA